MTRKRFVIVLLIVVLLIIGISIFFWYKNPDVSNSVGKVGSLPETSLDDLQKEADASKFSFKINSNPVFKDGNSEGNLRIENPHYNKFPIEVIIRLKSNNEVVFKTGKMEPNHYIESAKLNENLPKGTYKAVATIKAFDFKNNDKCLGKANAILNIHIKN